jgi:hypothetical protein
VPEIVEGYKTSQDPAAPGPRGADSWVDGLRKELRREMIRELAMRRIRSNGREYQPQAPSRTSRMVEAFFVGVAVTIASSWLCSLARKEGRDE